MAGDLQSAMPVDGEPDCTKCDLSPIAADGTIDPAVVRAHLVGIKSRLDRLSDEFDVIHQVLAEGAENLATQAEYENHERPGESAAN